ncbi:MAG: zinc-dependent alcohol dehydrogenase family protein [Bacteroidota bacterium]
MPKTIFFNKAEGPESLEVVETAIPNPGATEVVVEMKAAGLNRSEYMFLTNTYVFQPSFPSTIGTEGAGIVYDVGSQVTEFKRGDEVCITPNILPQEYGVMGQYVNVPVEALLPKPPELSFDQAASVWMSLSTAYFGLISNGGLKPHFDQTVLVTAASSSLGVAVIQMAKFHGAKVIATSRTSAKKAFLLSMGADHVIATEEEDLQSKVRQFTDGKGFDIGFDMVAGDMIPMLADVAAPHATILLGGLLSLEIPEIPFLPMVMKNLSLRSFHVVLHLLRKPELFEVASKHILEGLRNGHYSAEIDRVFDFPNVADAYAYLANSTQQGKVVVRF